MSSLFSFFNSSAADRVRIALALKGLEYQDVGINIRADEHRAPEYVVRNPARLEPTFEDDGISLNRWQSWITWTSEPGPQLIADDVSERGACT